MLTLPKAVRLLTRLPKLYKPVYCKYQPNPCISSCSDLSDSLPLRLQENCGDYYYFFSADSDFQAHTQLNKLFFAACLSFATIFFTNMLLIIGSFSSSSLFVPSRKSKQKCLLPPSGGSHIAHPGFTQDLKTYCTFKCVGFFF